MNQRVMELARESQVAISRRELDELLQSHRDYTRAVLRERDGLLESVKIAIDERDHYMRERDQLNSEYNAALENWGHMQETNAKLRKELAELTAERDQLRSELEVARAWLHEADASDKQLRKEVERLKAACDKYSEAELLGQEIDAEPEGCWKCGEDGGTSCGAAHCGLLEPEPDELPKAEQVQPNNDEVICPNCVTQFRAIPVNVQEELIGLRKAAQAALDFLYRVTQWKEAGHPDLHDIKQLLRKELE